MSRKLYGQKCSRQCEVFTYRYFLNQFPDLCILAVPSITGNNDPAEKREPIGCVVCKIDEEFQGSQIVKSGYMAMLAVDMAYRKAGIGTALVKRAVKRMQHKGCSSVTLETEVSNVAAIRLYEERLGFVREELLVRYYLNWGDAYRLRLWL